MIDEHIHEVKFVYPAFGLFGEVGEVANKLKKVIRDQNGKLDYTDEEFSEYYIEHGNNPIIRKNIEDELGDVMWYVAQTASELHLSLDEIATGNIAKLAKRAKENKLGGSGDTR